MISLITLEPSYSLYTLASRPCNMTIYGLLCGDVSLCDSIIGCGELVWKLINKYSSWDEISITSLAHDPQNCNNITTTENYEVNM